VTLIEEHLRRLHQDHLLSHIEELPQEKLEKLEEQLSFLDQDFLFELQRKKENQTISLNALSPFTAVRVYGDSASEKKGWEGIRAGKVGVLIAAGGQGSRLGFLGPKGAFPLSPVRSKSLFELHMEKIVALQRLAGGRIPVAIMTSSLNHEETVRFFSEHRYFGLDKEQLFFFQQKLLPLLTEEGKLFFSAPGEISFGPNGNGSAIEEFVRSGIYEEWAQKGISHVQFLPVDNPLALPVDPEMIGEALLKDLECVVKVIERLDPKESVGIMALKDKKPAVVEYSEIPKELRDAQDSQKRLLYPWANISVFCFSLSFIHKAYEHSDQLAWHVANKTVPSYDPVTKDMVERHCKKFERFIFDIFAFADRLEAIAFPREKCFAPLKGGEGKEGVQSVQNMLSDYEKRLFQEKYNVKIEEDAFECDPKLYFSFSDRE